MIPCEQAHLRRSRASDEEQTPREISIIHPASNFDVEASIWLVHYWKHSSMDGSVSFYNLISWRALFSKYNVKFAQRYLYGSGSSFICPSAEIVHRENPFAPIRCSLALNHKLGFQVERDYFAQANGWSGTQPPDRTYWWVQCVILNLDYMSAGREFAERLEVQTYFCFWDIWLLLVSDNCFGNAYLLVGWLLAAMSVSGKICQVGSFEGGKVTQSFDVKQECYIIIIENNVHILPDPAYLPGLCVALSVNSNSGSNLYICCYFYSVLKLVDEFWFFTFLTRLR